MVDGISEPTGLSSCSPINISLYTTLSHIVLHMDKIKQRVQSRIANTSTVDTLSANISAVEVGTCIAMLQCHKNSGGTGRNTNHFKYVSTDLHYYVVLLLSAVVCHGSVPNDFLLCDLQFGLKAKRSTALCSMVLKETISYYVNHGSSVFCVFLDATKAFDRVQYRSLFDKLLNRNVDPLYSQDNNNNNDNGNDNDNDNDNDNNNNNNANICNTHSVSKHTESEAPAVAR